MPCRAMAKSYFYENHLKRLCNEQVEVNSNWLIIPYGTHTRYFDKAAGVYRLKFMPFGSILTKSETQAAARFVKTRTTHMARLLYGISVKFGPYGFDASDAFRGGLVIEDDPFFTDYPHAFRKITQEKGKALLEDKNNLEYVVSAVQQLWVCTSTPQHNQLCEIVIDELRSLGEDPISDWLMKAGSGYFVEPWNQWFIGSPRITLHDGGRTGSKVEYHNIGPITQPGEYWNKKLGLNILMNKRTSKEHLVGKVHIFPLDEPQRYDALICF